MSPEAPPPHYHISSRPLSTTAASAILESYLRNSESHPHLHPDALITPTGVTFSSAGGAMGGVVLHNLRRVAAGLRGEWVGVEEEEGEEREGIYEEGREWERSGKKGGKRKGVVDGRMEVGGRGEAFADDWQDKATYELEEGVMEVGEIGERTNFVAEGAEVPEIEETMGGAQEGVHGNGKRRKSGDGEERVDKNARKKAKKEKNLERKRKMAQKNAENAG